MRETTVATTIFLRIALCLLALASTTTAQADPTDDYIAAQMRSQNIPGLSLAIIKDGKIVKERDDVISASRYAMMCLRFAIVNAVAKGWEFKARKIA